MTWLDRLAQGRRRRLAEVADENGRTQLMWAASRIKSAEVEQLLADGVDPLRVDHQGNSALHHAFLDLPSEPQGWLCAMRLIRAGVDMNAPNHQGETPALLALRHMVKGGYSGYRDRVQFLVDHGLDLLLSGKDGESPASLLANNPELFGKWSQYAQVCLEQARLETRTAPAVAVSRPVSRL